MLDLPPSTEGFEAPDENWGGSDDLKQGDRVFD